MGARRFLWSMVFAAVLFGVGLILSGTVSYAYVQCGDGNREGAEECDNGAQNSDSAPNACRTDCTKARCGDGAIDSGEECDDHYTRNSDVIPNACRRNCKRAFCGDGVLDEDEQCDDKNSNDYDGCYQCMTCLPVKDNLEVSYSNETVRLCPGTYELADSGQEGVLIIDGYNATVDCRDVYLVGAPPGFIQAGKPKVTAGAQQLKGFGSTKGGMRVAGKRGLRQPAAQPQTNTGTQNPPPTPPPGSAMTPKAGTGIVIKGQDIILQNCSVTGFRTGVKMKSTSSVLVNNRICGNSTDIVGEQAGSFGAKNACTKVQNWQENCAAGCMSGCQ